MPELSGIHNGAEGDGVDTKVRLPVTERGRITFYKIITAVRRKLCFSYPIDRQGT
jgi:hypothetical protein